MEEGAATDGSGAEEVRLCFGPYELRTDSGVLLREGVGVSSELLEDLVDIAVTECERFYPAFQFVIWGGKSATEALTAAMLETEGEA